MADFDDFDIGEKEDHDVRFEATIRITEEELIDAEEDFREAVQTALGAIVTDIDVLEIYG